MEIEIWSDIVCPFCYIGKRRLEEAISTLHSKTEIKITWKSFLLNPEIETDPSKSILEYLAEEKGIPLNNVKEIIAQANNMAKEIGLDYDLEKTVVANSLKAHRFLHYCHAQGKQLEAKELLFNAHFIEHKNIDDNETLFQIAKELGLNLEKITALVQSNLYEDAVKFDVYEASQLGVRGVPFFVFNNKYGISGAQPLEVFLETLEKVTEEARTGN
jgi:predicted DsbA family dithiol-disulfide isomerase